MLEITFSSASENLRIARQSAGQVKFDSQLGRRCGSAYDAAMHIEMDLPESAFSALRLSPVEFVREMRVAAALKWYEVGLISQSKAAAVAGVSREALLMAAGKFRVSAVQSTPAELAEELSRD